MPYSTVGRKKNPDSNPKRNGGVDKILEHGIEGGAGLRYV
jgi:hypothetical protein